MSGCTLRVGLGEDLHPLVAGRPLVLGGVRFEAAVGPLGHSDGDVVLHALADALLGATAGGDIGDRFPDDDPAHRDADSSQLLGWMVVNADIVIAAERPRLGAGKQAIRDRVAALLEVPPGRVNVKAKTGEGLGSIGRGEAIGCRVVVLIQGTEAQ
jgi:2-C-methyl-D-erythritol 2,4-cyclodiphosphate synthase